MADYKDILFDVRDGVAKITINRPEKYNAFTAETCEELIDAFRRAGYDKSVAVIVLGSAGDKAFCTGADQSAHEGAYEGRGTIGLPIDELQSLIRDVPKPVIARVQGFHRRRQRPGDPVRSHHCVGEGGVRSGRAQGGVG